MEWWPHILVAHALPCLPLSLPTLPPTSPLQIVVMLSGLLPRPEVTMSMMGITFNVHALCFFAAHGLSGAASTRVGNELGELDSDKGWVG